MSVMIIVLSFKKWTKMKYIIICLTILFSVAWYLLQSSNMNRIHNTKVQIYGKVQGLQGNLLINIEDNLLALRTSDRFTFQISRESPGKLTMKVIKQPKGQHCEITKLNAVPKRMNLNILCENNTQSSLNNAVVGL
jgi:hypothetical protein